MVKSDKPICLFLDIDGTLTIFGSNKISKENVNALKQFKKYNQNNKIILATGRSFPRTLRVKPNVFKLVDYVICSGGSLVFDKNKKLIYKNNLTQEGIDELMPYYNNGDALTYMTINGDYITQGTDDKVIKENHQITHDSNIPTMMLKEHFYDELKNNNIVSLTIYSKNKKKYLNNKYDNLILGDSLCYSFDVWRKGSSKGETILNVFKDYKETHSFIAIGDSGGDISMLSSVDYPIVMDNAKDEVKKYGKYITKSVYENGVANAIDLILKGEL